MYAVQQGNQQATPVAVAGQPPVAQPVQPATVTVTGVPIAQSTPVPSYAGAQAQPVAQPYPYPQSNAMPDGTGEAVHHAAPQPQMMVHEDDGPKPAGYLSAEDLGGCWCTTPLLGLHCYGLEAKGPNALVQNPIPCLCGFPFCTACGLGSCGMPLYQREGNSNSFTNQSSNETLYFKSKTEHLMPTIPMLGRPRVVKLCELPGCCYSIFSSPVCCCCHGVYR